MPKSVAAEPRGRSGTVTAGCHAAAGRGAPYPEAVMGPHAGTWGTWGASVRRATMIEALDSETQHTA